MTNRRDRGILTPEDREYLRGDKQFEHRQSEYNAKSRIRDRTTDALLDTRLLWRHLPEEERVKIFDPYPGGGLQTAIESALAFLYAGVSDREEFELMLEEAIRQERQSRDLVPASVDVSIEIEAERPRDELLEEWNQLSDEEKLDLIDANPALALGDEFSPKASLFDPDGGE